MRLLSLAIPLPPLEIFPGRDAPRPAARPRKRAKAKRAQAAAAPAAPAVARRRPKRRALPRPPARLVGMAAAALLLSSGTIWAMASGALASAAATVEAVTLDATAAAGLSLRQITVDGRNRTGAGDILAALQVSRGDALLGIDVHAAREALESLPWVKTAVVSRTLPGVLHVALTERRPLALWQQEPSRFLLTDAEGRPIVVGDIARWGHLPVIVGKGAPEAAAALFKLLNTQPDIAARVKAATRLGDRRWDVLLDDFATGVTVKLPEHDAAAAWARFAEVQRARNILGNDLAAIDMRLPDRMIVRLKGDGIPMGDRRKSGPDLRRDLPLPPDAGQEA